MGEWVQPSYNRLASGSAHTALGGMPGTRHVDSGLIQGAISLLCHMLDTLCGHCSNRVPENPPLPIVFCPHMSTLFVVAVVVVRGCTCVYVCACVRVSHHRQNAV